MKIIKFFGTAYIVQGIFYDSSAVVTTLAGQLTAGSIDGIGISAKLNNPASFCEAPDGTIYEVECDSHTVKKFNPLTNEVTTFAGSGRSGYKNGIGTSASFSNPQSCVVDENGNIYVGNFMIAYIFC